MEYQQIKFFGMACWWWCPGVSTAALFSHCVCGGLLGKRSGVLVAGLCLAHCWVLRQQGLFAAMQGILGVSCCSCGRHRLCVFVGWVWLTGLLFENYIVDASIWTHGPALFLGVWVVCSSNFFDE